MKTLITAILCFALVGVDFEAKAPEYPTNQPPQKECGLACIIVIIVIGGVVYTIVRGLLRMCKNLPVNRTNAPPVLTNAPNTLDLTLGLDTGNSTLVFQYCDSPGQWQEQCHFTVDDQFTNVVVTAFDPSGNALTTNNVTPGALNGERAAYADFTQILPPITNAPPARIFRLVAIP